ncbi:MAG: hypothetical protein ACOCPU_05750 [Methanohalophilus sp.]
MKFIKPIVVIFFLSAILLTSGCADDTTRSIVQSGVVEIEGENIRETVQYDEENIDLYINGDSIKVVVEWGTRVDSAIITGNNIEVLFKDGASIEEIYLSGSRITVIVPKAQYPVVQKEGNDLGVIYY